MCALQLEVVLLRTKISATFCFTCAATVKFVFFRADPILPKGHSSSSGDLFQKRVRNLSNKAC